MALSLFHLVLLSLPAFDSVGPEDEENSTAFPLSTSYWNANAWISTEVIDPFSASELELEDLLFPTEPTQEDPEIGVLDRQSEK